MLIHAKDPRAKTVKEATLDNGVKRTIKGYTNDLMLAEMIFMKGMVGALHSHPHAQIGYVVKGCFEVDIAGEKGVLKAGDVYYTEPNQIHGAVCLEDNSVLLDVFTPYREDYLA